jgi:hypothetical protein
MSDSTLWIIVKPTKGINPKQNKKMNDNDGSINYDRISDNRDNCTDAMRNTADELNQFDSINNEEKVRV